MEKIGKQKSKVNFMRFAGYTQAYVLFLRHLHLNLTHEKLLDKGTH